MKRKVMSAAALALRVCFILAMLFFWMLRGVLSPIQGGNDFERVKTKPIFVPAPIQDVLVGDGRIYILYASTGAVNVYDEEGGFLWSIAVPWHDHTDDVQMRGQEDSLFLWQRMYKVYQYDLETGAYQTSFLQREHEEEFPAVEPPPERVPESQIPEGMYTYDALTVYRQTEAGNVPVVARGGWVRLTFSATLWAIGFISGLGMVILGLMLGSHGDRKGAIWQKPPALQSRRGKRLRALARGMTALCVLYAAAMLIAAVAFHTAVLSIGIMPLAVCFIVSGIYISNAQYTVGEDAFALRICQSHMWEAMIGAFLSVLVGNLLV